MPTYQYRCTSCGDELEVVQRFTDDALTECPACQGRLRKVFSPVGVVFKGSGFYKTDSRGAKPATAGANGKADANASEPAAAAAKESAGAPAGDSASAGAAAKESSGSGGGGKTDTSASAPAPTGTSASAGSGGSTGGSSRVA